MSTTLIGNLGTSSSRKRSSVELNIDWNIRIAVKDQHSIRPLHLKPVVRYIKSSTSSLYIQCSSPDKKYIIDSKSKDRLTQRRRHDIKFKKEIDADRTVVN